MSDKSEELKERFSVFSAYGPTFDRAIEAVVSGAVKEHRFLPSRRTIYTVVGSHRDEFIDPAKPYCSCSNFFFRVLGGHQKTCYHLLSYNIASQAGMVDVIEFDDEEYGPLFVAITKDVLSTLDRAK